MRSCSLRSVCSGSVILVAFALYLQIGYVRSSGKPAVPGLAAYPDVLLVFEYDGSFDWEVVLKDARTKDAVEWMRNLPDRLTQTSADPAGQELLVRTYRIIQICICTLQPELHMHAATYEPPELVKSKLQAGSSLTIAVCHLPS